MNHVYVDTDRELNELEIAEIRDIMLHASCPNESLLNSIEGCKGINPDTLVINIGDGEITRIIVEY